MAERSNRRTAPVRDLAKSTSRTFKEMFRDGHGDQEDRKRWADVVTKLSGGKFRVSEQQMPERAYAADMLSMHLSNTARDSLDGVKDVFITDKNEPHTCCDRTSRATKCRIRARRARSARPCYDGHAAKGVQKR